MIISYTTRIDDMTIEQLKIKAAKERVAVCELIQKALDELLSEKQENIE